MKYISIFFITIFFIVIFLLTSFIRDSYFLNSISETKEIAFLIEEGQSAKWISQNLEDQGIIGNHLWFDFYVWLSKSEKDFQPGVFTLRPGMSYANLVREMTLIELQEVSITIPEGFTLEQIGKRLEEKELVTMDEWSVAVSEDYRNLFSFLKSQPELSNLEGYLFPDTYRFLKEVSAQEIIVKMLTNFGNKLTPDLRIEIEKQGHTIHEVITLASIIEREVRTDEDRAMVSDLFWRRLSAGMPLQADSTVNYITQKNTPSISYEDAGIDSAWNTYKYTGLPPGPIANPGIASIEAAIFPEPNVYWYFLTDASGQVYYARTNQEQNENKSKYLR
ncbi:endolytic transglycosylase MltG [Candidatus Uhrbacteria bacterium CG_4_9_14_3_um_filter_36_7]|uniref:Endolytic murein transglycosylase n=1 Tax=Candidatus Uhrbacteria bacterium CG_4_9_14_3_um_filter_36_7 TaxID=1975033 RepID=A0A2M7XEU0_9BACT|nr:MAG: endolytic transglycosylase MltG [Candidatus Uhrbacteria bacterium CG_4_9_14_3_um_filter_36_7]